jgi:host factor-I protein
MNPESIWRSFFESSRVTVKESLVPVESSNRKLIRPPLAEPKERAIAAPRVTAAQKKAAPPETTNAENYYWLKQMQAKTLMVVVMSDGEELHGIVEWYDRTCIKLTREGEPNLLVYKSFIKYLYKAGE